MKDKSDKELLEIVLRKQFGRVADKSLRDVVQSGQVELGLTPLAYEQLIAGIELGKRVSEPRADYNTALSSSSLAIEFCKAHFSRLISEGIQEEFHIVTLNTKNRIIDSHLITVGTLDASLVHPREVFRPAIKDSSSSILLAHNHPSGDPTPSREDRQVTDRLTESGKLLGIDVLDHIVLGRERCISIREYS